MKVLVKNIPDEGIEIDRSFSSEDLGLYDDDVVSLGPIAVQAKIDKADDAVVVKTKVEGKYRCDCSRCLEPVDEERADVFDFAIEIDEKTEAIDLGDNIRQELILAFSSVALCNENCKGICKNCGVNLNQEKCKCDPSS